MEVVSEAPPAAAGERRTWITVAFATMCSAFPAFVTGALGVQLRDEVGLSATQIGVAMAVSFAVAAVSSAPMGRLAERLGPQWAFRSGLTTSAVAMLLLAAVAREFWQFCAFLAIAGAANAISQPSANLMLATHVPAERMGFALAAKQSGMPAAALLGGGAVPAIALTVGWEWAYALGAALAVAACVVLPRDPHDPTRPARRGSAFAMVIGQRATRPDLGVGLLVLYAVVGFLGAANAGAMVGFITIGAEESGLAPGAAGLVLSLGSLVGIASRIFQGIQVDRRGILPIQRLVWLFALGGLGVLGLAIDVPASYLVATIPAFAFGWAWPGLFNLSVVRNNPSAPGAATGISQVGIFAGAAAGPALGGLIIDNGSYRMLWTAGACILFLGATVAVYLRTRIRASRA